MRHFETTISFSYYAETPQDAAMQFLHNIRNVETNWDILVKDIETKEEVAIDTEND